MNVCQGVNVQQLPVMRPPVAIAAAISEVVNGIKDTAMLVTHLRRRVEVTRPFHEAVISTEGQKQNTPRFR